MATARITAGAVLETIVVAANTVNGSLGALSNGVGMLNAYVNKAAKQQALRHEYEDLKFEQDLQEEFAEAAMTQRLRIKKLTSQSADHAKFFQEALAEYQALGKK